MMFAAPWILLALALLPILWWLLRATPPAPRDQIFPAIRLLANLRSQEETPARTPWWLLALRLTAAGLVIVGLAGPILGAGGLKLLSHGTALLVIDDGFASGPDWPARVAAAQSVLDRLEHANTQVALLTTAQRPTGDAPRATAAMPAALLRPLLAALHPQAWPVDRAAVAGAVKASGSGPVFYIADNLAGAGDSGFAGALAAHGPVEVLTGDLPTRLLLARAEPERMVAVLRQTAVPAATHEMVLAETGDGSVLGREAITVPAGATRAEVAIALPPELRNQFFALRLAGAPGAGSVALLDEGSRRRPVGLLSAGTGGETPLLGDNFYIERALGASAELRHGDAASLLSRKISMLVSADGVIGGSDADRIEAWVKQGGILVRFAGPGLAEQAAQGGVSANLLPEPLLAGDRQLGGAMSWSQPAHLAPFPPGPFAGLAVPAEVTVNRQVLADPQTGNAPQVWAVLTDGTPLVTAARLGAGEIVLFHVTANADWSNLPLSGLFVDMLSRLVQRSAGVAAADDFTLAPAQALNGLGVLGAPPPAAQPVGPNALGTTVISAVHPPGFYGPEHDRHALNIGSEQFPLVTMARVPGSTRVSLLSAPREEPVGPWLIALALALLCADMLLTLRLRGLLRPAFAALLLVVIAGHASAAQALAAQALAAQASTESPALATHLAYVVTGDANVDATSKAGLAGLSAYVNLRTAAVLADPAAVVPGRDDLSFYPLLYWPITASATGSPAATAALNDYMRHGGIVIIDLQGGGAAATGTGAGFAPGAEAALRRAADGLEVPRLAPLTSAHVLARAFYLLSDFPGRFDGSTVWVQQDQDRANDSVSPVIVGSNDWAAAWAADDDGRPLFAVIPGGQRQRVLAYRFGVNMVMYALTGNYKGDQVHVPAILERLGQ
jgi:hypothetical protein